MKHTTLSFVLPCHNEQSVIGRTIRDAHAWFLREGISGEIIVVDNGSTDRTAQILDRLQKEIVNLVVVSHRTNRGYGGSILSGCDMARMETIAYMDSDGQFAVEDLGHLLPSLRSVPFVSGIRQKRSDSYGRKISSFLWNIFVRMVLGIHAKDIDCGMKAFHRSIWPLVRPVYGTGNLFSAEMFYRLKRNGLPYRQKAVRHFPRVHGKANCTDLSSLLLTFSQLWKLLTDNNALPNNIKFEHT